MAIDKVKPLKIEESGSGTESDMFPTEVDPSEDYLATKGIALENLETHVIDRSGNDIQFTDPSVGVKSVDQLQSTVRASSNDTTPGNLSQKIVAGTGVDVFEVNDGANETLRLDTNDSEINHNSLSNLTTGDVHTQYTRKDTLTTKGDIYVRNAAAPQRLGIGTNDFALLADSATNEGVAWKQLTGDMISFVDTASTFKPATTSVRAALEELRTTTIVVPEVLTSVLNTTKSLVKDDTSFIDIEGTATGYVIKLPDATTLVEGRVYEIINDTSEQIEIQDGGATKLFDLNVTDIARLTLQHNDTVAGDWIVNISSSTASGIVSTVLTSDTNFATGSATDVLITGFTVTPVSGRYSLFFAAEVLISANNKIGEVVAYVDGSAIENTRRKTQGVGSNFESNVTTVGEVTVNGSQAVDIRTNVSNGTYTIEQRSLVLIRLGT